MRNTAETSTIPGPGVPSPGLETVKICIIAPSAAAVGGQALQAQRLLRHLSTTPGINVDFLPINPRLWGPLHLLQRIKYVRTVFTWIAYVASLALRIHRYDVIHIFSAAYLSFALAPMPAIFVFKLFGRAVLLNYHSGEADDHLTRSRRVAVPVLGSVDAIVVPSRYLVEVFDRHGLTAESVANVVDLDRYPYRRRETLLPRFLGNRNFAALYNVECAIRAFALIKRAQPAATLVLAGDGECRPALERLVDELGLRDAVTLVGQVSSERMAELYDTADVYLNASNIDNMPLSILEAFACGLPVVTTDAGGIPYILEHDRTGLMVPRNDSEELARQALRLFDEPHLARRMTEAAYEECKDSYTWPSVEREWVRIYTRLSQRKSGPPPG